MKPPPGALRRSHNFTRRETRPGITGSDKREFTRYDPKLRRALLLRCDRCGAIATGRVTRHGVVISQGFKVEYGKHTVSSVGRCGGRVRAFDIIPDGDGDGNDDGPAA